MKKRFNRYAMAAAMALGSITFAGALSTSLAQPVMPQMQKYEGIDYMSGGIGQAQSDAMQAASGKFPLALTFSQRAGKVAEFVANVPVTIKNAAGKSVLSATSEGPYMFVNLPAGEYTIHATYNGRAMERHAIVRSDGTTSRIYFEW